MWLRYGCATVNGRSPLLPASEVNLTYPLRNSNGVFHMIQFGLSLRIHQLYPHLLSTLLHIRFVIAVFFLFVLLSAKSPVSNSSLVARARGVTQLYAVTSQTACIDGSILRQAGCCIASSTFRFRQSKPSTRAAGPGGMYLTPQATRATGLLLSVPLLQSRNVLGAHHDCL